MAHLIDSFETNRTLRSFWRFLAVGTLGTLVDVTLFTVLHALIGVPTVIANTISYSAGGINNFVLHRRWTYKRQANKAFGVQLSRFAVISLSALMMNNIFVLLLTPTFNTFIAHTGFSALLAKIGATALGFCWNFFANRYWTFSQHTNKSMSVCRSSLK
jgi:putative flippase GtrA